MLFEGQAALRGWRLLEGGWVRRRVFTEMWAFKGSGTGCLKGVWGEEKGTL